MTSRARSILLLALCLFALNGAWAQNPCDLISFHIARINDCCFDLRVENNLQGVPSPFTTIQLNLGGGVSFSSVVTAPQWTQNPANPTTSVDWTPIGGGSIPSGVTPVARVCLTAGPGVQIATLTFNIMDASGAVLCTKTQIFDLINCDGGGGSQICGQKFHDLDGDGVKDNGEPGLPGWTINLKNLQTNAVVSVITDANGNYCFDGGPGSWMVYETHQPGWRQTFPAPPGIYIFSLAAGEGKQNLDFGNVEGCLRVSEPILRCNPDGTVSMTVTVTNLSGVNVSSVAFNSVSPANVTITPNPVAVNIPNGGSSTINVTIGGPGALPGALVCFTLTLKDAFDVACCSTLEQICVRLPNCLGHLCGQKFHDLDGDGVKDNGEPGLPGWTINLYDGNGNLVATTTTDANGNYCFNNLAPGIYVVTEAQQNGWTQTFPAFPGVHSVNVAAGQTINNLDFGNVEQCLRITNERVTCNPDGSYRYCFTLTNLFMTSITKISFANSSPAGATFTPNPITIAPLAYGQSTNVCVDVTVPVTVPPTTQLCFTISIHDREDEENCCGKTHCIRLPDCASCVDTNDCCDRKSHFLAQPAPSGPGFLGQVAVVTAATPCDTQTLCQPPLRPYVVNVFDISNKAPQFGTNTNWFAPVYNNEMPNPTNNPADVWNKKNLGYVFGVTHDSSGNIYVAATSAFGVGIVGSGGPGAIYRLDGNNGAISVFSTLPNTGAAIGNISFDCIHNVDPVGTGQFFATNMDDGLIYRIDRSGSIMSTYDHGVAGRAAASLSAIPDVPSQMFTPLGRRVWAVQYFNNRVYYSVWWENCQNGNATQSNEVWSVGLQANGDFDPPTARLEFALPGGLSDTTGVQYSNPVSDISFSQQGKMMVAERTMAGDASPNAHASRALEYICRAGSWVPSPNTFSIGVTGVSSGCPIYGGPVGTNSAGGTDYGPDNFVYVTGDALIFGSQFVYGFQILPAAGGSTANSAMVDVNSDTSGITALKTSVGDIEVPCLNETNGSSVAGDTNLDGCVDDADVTNIILDFGGSGGTTSGFHGTDVNHDSVVDDTDLTIALLHYGEGC